MRVQEGSRVIALERLTPEESDPEEAPKVEEAVETRIPRIPELPESEAPDAGSEE